VKANLRCSQNPIFSVRHEEDCKSGIQALSESNTDVILLDLNLPDSSGLDTLRAVREVATGIPIVVMSEWSSEDEAIQAVHQGAQDCLEKSEAITKPLGHPLQYSIERYHRQHAERDIASAAFVQRRLFPTRLPPVPGFDVSGRCDPANHVGGDYFDYFLVDEDQLIVVIGDVTGHGFGPSLVMAETRAALRTMAATTSDVGTMIDQVNNLIHDHDFNWFVTLFLGRIDTKTGHCSFASAAQPAILMRADGTFEELYSQDHPLGIATGVTFGVFEADLRNGDTMLLYTDGISERSAGPSHFFGVDRINRLLTDTKKCSAVETIDLIFDAANRFAEFRTQVDDMTAVVIKVSHNGSL
jgi:sigma-B regulation protein RsbU (phosphoserine phosphatase)